MPAYEIRQGDENIGLYHYATISADDIAQALRKVKRRNLISLPIYWKRELVEVGNEKKLTLYLYGNPCPYMLTITKTDI